MERREFLKLAAIAGTAIALTPIVNQTAQAARQVEHGGRTFRGTDDGRLLESANGGQTWTPKANFGPHLNVIQVTAQGGEMLIALGLPGGFAFGLRSYDEGITWHTMDFEKPQNGPVI